MARTTLAIGALALLLAYQGYITYRIATHQGLRRGQKIAQCALVWLLPLLGAVIVHMLVGFDTEARPADRDFTPQTRNDGGESI